MRYTIDYCNRSFEVSARADAKITTLVKKVIHECMKQTGVTTCQYWVDYPNIWRNGAVGSLSVNGNFVGIRESDCEAYMFIQ